MILGSARSCVSILDGFSLCHSEPLRRRIPESFLGRSTHVLNDTRTGILRSADSTQNDTKKDSALNDTNGDYGGGWLLACFRRIPRS